MALIGEMQYLTIGDKTYSLPIAGSDGTVTSVRVQATSPVVSSVNTAQTTSLNTTISLADNYGDTKNPYAAKAANKILAGPVSGNNAAPTFRSLVAADIPDLSGTYLTSYTETDPTVPSWAKASSKPTYTASEVGASPTGHTHATTLASGTTGDTSTITLASAGKYKLTAGGTNVVFTMPTIPTVNYPVTSVNTKTGAVTLTASDVGASTTGHTHSTSIASGGSSPTTLSANTTYTLTAGGTTAVFKTPANPDYSNTYAAKSHSHAWSDITSGNDDLNAIEGLTGTSGLLRKTAANTWSLDTKAYITGGSNSSSAVTITPTTTSVYSITNVGTANTPTAIDVTKFNGGSYSHTGFSGGSGSFTQGAFSGGSLTMTINSSDTSQLDIAFTAATHGTDSHSHTAATYGTDSFTAASLGTGFYTAGTAATMPTRSQVTNLWNGYSTASAASQTFTGSTS